MYIVFQSEATCWCWMYRTLRLVHSFLNVSDSSIDLPQRSTMLHFYFGFLLLFVQVELSVWFWIQLRIVIRCWFFSGCGTSITNHYSTFDFEASWSTDFAPISAYSSHSISKPVVSNYFRTIQAFSIICHINFIDLLFLIGAGKLHICTWFPSFHFSQLIPTMHLLISQPIL